MSNEQKLTNTPDMEPDFFAVSGVHFIYVLSQLALDPKSAQFIKNDWHTIETWLGCADRPLSDFDKNAIAKAWKAYIAIGVAPSTALQPVFDGLSKKCKSTNEIGAKDRPPQQILSVFDRLLASDTEIQNKRTADIAASQASMAQIASLLRGERVGIKVSWWRRQSHTFRVWIFASVLWIVISYFYIRVFDPFHLGDWTWARDKDYIRAFAIVFAPVFVGFAKWLYDKLVR